MNAADILYHITVASKPEELVETPAGQMSYRQWLETERARIRRKGGWPVEVWTNPSTGEISLVHLRLTKG
ncbi:MAG: hypothetical protein ACO3EH_00415 [Ilumatobacteraceae bacterium]